MAIRDEHRARVKRGAPCAGGPARSRLQSASSAARPVTDAQISAIRSVMQLFVEDDLAGGMAPDAQRWCERCRRDRRAAGFIRYGDSTVCNACATTYEVARVAGEVRNFDGFLRRG